ncbi:TonB-dependent siderophore receptor [Sphingosinicella rhizophila]|uniref:TonB-dependent siderophore receptor n=1 Tax=Sphingosinicella rhizophila TaxID=3050082 RepID=A0ABU3Q9E7_9SPHN|nr:TonB-dependent siderophore receptor [Sphingosinicella sp. GR2756]MDT9600026.1 TonB-dependent siderophore receptor [Sphingosinicella sp. GR2756]
MNKSHFLASAGFVLALGLGAASPAMAEDRGTADAAETGDTGLEGNGDAGQEIVVTGSYTTNEELNSATGLGLTIQETPQSVTVMTEQRMKDQAIRTLSDVINNAAGVSSKAFDSSRNGFSARGFAIDNYQIDGVPVQWDAATAAGETEIDVALYERVEIVRGATGLLSGAGNPSASINLIRKHATSDRLAAEILASASRWNNFSIMGDIMTPITGDGTIRARAVAKYEEGDSFVDLLHDKKLVLYGVIDADVTPDTRISIGASYQDNSPRGTLWGGLPVWHDDGSRTDWPRSKTIGADWTHWSSENETYFAHLSQRLGANWLLEAYGTLTRNTGTSKLLYISGQSNEATGLGLFDFPARYLTRVSQIDTGLRLKGRYQLFGREHDLILGASYARQKMKFYSYAADQFFGIGNFNLWDGSYPEPGWGPANLDMDLRTKQWGYFGATRLSLADPLKLILGARLSSWTREGISYGSEVDFGDRDKFIPYVGLLYDIVPDHTVYASYTKIFDPQDFQDRNDDFLPPVDGANYEIGLKSSFFGGQLNTAISLFRIEQNNLAQPDIVVIDPITGLPRQTYRAAAGARSEGFEIEANGEVLPGWNVSVNYTQFEAKDASGDGVNTLFPDKLLRLFTTYDFEAGALAGLTIGGGVNWEGTSYTDTFNPVLTDGNGDPLPERLKVESYALVNLMARYRLPGGLSAQINVENLFDKKYYSQIGFYDQLAFGEPRNVTLTLGYAF